MIEPLLTTKQVATLLGCTEAGLELWRKTEQGPAYLKLGRLIRYRQEDVEDWLRKK